MAFRISLLSLLAVLKIAGIDNLPKQPENEAYYVDALVSALDTAGINGAAQADLVQSAIDSVKNGTFRVCPFNYEDLNGNRVESVTLVLSDQNCDGSYDVNEVTQYRIVTYLERVKSFIQPVQQSVFSLFATASSAIRETGYTLKDAVWAALLSGPGGFAVLFYLFRFAKSLYYYVMNYFLPLHEDVTNKIVQIPKVRNYNKLWKKNINKVIAKKRTVKAFQDAKTDNKTNIKMLHDFVESNVGPTGSDDDSNRTLLDSDVDSDVGSTHTDVDSEHGRGTGKTRPRDRSRSRGGKPSKKTKKNRRSKKRKSR